MSPSEPAAIASRVCAIVVTWQPELPPLRTLISSLLTQQCPVIVIDNGSDALESLRTMLSELNAGAEPEAAYTQLVSWPENRGLAKAMNEGLQRARQAGFDFVLLFDQDSLISEGFVSALQQQWQQLTEAGSTTQRLPPAAIGPRLQDPVSGRRTTFRCFRWRRRSDCAIPGLPGLYETDFLVSSGTLISMTALQRIGPMKDEYFIDNIDLEWCFRARAQGYGLYGSDQAVLFHRIGESSRNPLVNSGLMVQHSPLRSYYSTRNRIHLWRQPYAPLDWKLRDRLRFVLKSLWLICFTARRSEYRQQIWRGMQDARTLP